MYGYNYLLKDIKRLKDLGYEVGSIGNSTLSRPTPYVFIGKTKSPCALVFGAIHAREFITAPLTIELIKYYTKDMGIYVVPMANPDGVELCQDRGATLGSVPLDFLQAVNGGRRDFALWKANCRAVDLNVNFNADWGQGRQNVFSPAPANYVGEYPESEVETRNLVRFTNKINPIVTISYHTKGEVIYYGYKGYPDYYSEAKKFADITGYSLQKSNYSVGGYKDWFVKSYQRLGMTFEVGEERFGYPFPFSAFEQIVEKNKGVYDLLSEVGNTLWTKSLWTER